MINKIKRILKPEIYQGHSSNEQHFEGWYYKISDKEENNIFAIIPGIFKYKNNSNAEAFIQILDGSNGKSYNINFSPENFIADKNKFEIKIGENLFNSERIVLNIKNENIEMRGELKFTGISAIPVSFLSPGIMGWYSWVPFMECYHGIISMNHSINGMLYYNDKEINFSEGKGYTEKDWGKSFPKAWVWMQSNHFSDESISFSASIAIIPWLFRPFAGFIIAVKHNNTDYRFATYNKSQIVNFEIKENHIHWLLNNKNLFLEIYAEKPDGHTLIAPTTEGMNRRISETLNSVIHIKLSEKSKDGWKTIFEDTGRNSGLETAGDTDSLLKMNKNQNE